MNTSALPFDLVRADGDIYICRAMFQRILLVQLASRLARSGRRSAQRRLTPSQGESLSAQACIKAHVGELDRVENGSAYLAWSAAPGFTQIPAVINGCSDLLLNIFGADVGAHARSAVGMAELPFNVPIEIEAEVKIQL